jgi:hypothetical protein
MSGIGTLNEKPLHAALKEFYAHPGDRFEVKVDGFFIDIVQGDLLIEIQTGNFASLKSKLTKLTQERRVRLIYPIAIEKWIVKVPQEEGGRIIRRKSPKRGRVEELFWEMVSFPHLLAHPNFSLVVVMTNEEEVRYFNPNLNWRKRGWGTVERRLLDVVEQVVFESPADWRSLLSENIETFTTKELAKNSGISQKLAQKMAYCLRKAEVIELVGKRGRANLYKAVNS